MASSTGNDPISVIFSKLDNFKEGTKVAVADTVVKISESGPARKLGENEQLRKLGSAILTTFAPGRTLSSNSGSPSVAAQIDSDGSVTFGALFMSGCFITRSLLP